MNPDEKPKPTYQEQPIDEPITTDHPWQSSQDQPVVHLAPPAEPVAPTSPAEPIAAAPAPKKSFGQKLKALVKSRKFWLLVVALIVVSAAAAWFVQPSRLWLVNAFGARNTLTIVTMTPGVGKAKASELKNVTVTVNGQSYKTDDKGTLRLDNIPYGQATITAKKTGFQDINYGVMLDFDPFFHKLGGASTDQAARNIQLSLPSVGIPVSFKLVNYFTGKPVTSGDFTVGDVVAKPDDQGLVSLKIPGTDAHKVTVNVNFGGAYVDLQFDITLGGSTVPSISVVPAGRDYYISKKSGVATVYSSNLDGSDVQTIVAGTGQETDATAFAVSPDGKYGILASSRSGAKNAKQDVLQRVYVVNLSTKQITQVDEGVSVTFADWSGNTLVYTTTAYDATDNSYPATLRSVDASSGRVYNFETADYISVATVGFDRVIYQKYTLAGDGAATSPVLREAAINASSMKTLGESTSYDSYMQQDYNTIVFKTGQDQTWHQYSLSNDYVKNITQPGTGISPAVYLGAVYGDGNQRLVLDRVNGQPTLVMKDIKANTTTALYGAPGLGGPIRRVGNVVIFRVASSQGIADYALSLDGGQPKKIADITPTTTATAPIAETRFRLY